MNASMTTEGVIISALILSTRMSAVVNQVISYKPTDAPVCALVSFLPSRTQSWKNLGFKIGFFGKVSTF